MFDSSVNVHNTIQAVNSLNFTLHQTCTHVITRLSDHAISTERNIDSLHVLFNRNSSPQETFSLVIAYAGTKYHI